MTIVHYAFDVGSTRLGRFGWARAERAEKDVVVHGSPDINLLVKSITTDLDAGIALTLGVESPLFLPVPSHAAALGFGRVGDKDRSCFAPAGGYVATLGLHQLAFILRCIRRDGMAATLAWETWTPAPRTMLVWEAFVSGRAHCAKGDAAGHLRDAATAASYFETALAGAKVAGNPVRVADGTDPLSLVGLALLWSGWTHDPAVVRGEALVVKPEMPFDGVILPVG